MDDEKRLTLNEDEQATFARIRSMREEGVSYNRIAGRLNGEGVTTKRGGRWFSQTVKSVLSTKPIRLGEDA